MFYFFDLGSFCRNASHALTSAATGEATDAADDACRVERDESRWPASPCIPWTVHLGSFRIFSNGSFRNSLQIRVLFFRFGFVSQNAGLQTDRNRPERAGVGRVEASNCTFLRTGWTLAPGLPRPAALVSWLPWFFMPTISASGREYRYFIINVKQNLLSWGRGRSRRGQGRYGTDMEGMLPKSPDIADRLKAELRTRTNSAATRGHGAIVAASLRDAILMMPIPRHGVTRLLLCRFAGGRH